ncbi:MAG: hypothetical protein Tsb0019_26550 [Roseibium sp.]
MVESCDWVQDPTGRCEAELRHLREHQCLPVREEAPGGLLWKETLWTQVHSYREETEDFVRTGTDARAFDFTLADPVFVQLSPQLRKAGGSI